MRQVLFRIPLRIFDWMPSWIPDSWPIYGFGVMLVMAFLICPWMAYRRAEKEGIAKERIQDLAIWIFICGIIGARITFMRLASDPPRPFTEFFNIWQGGLVFYGSAIGGLVGYIGAYHFVLRKYNISTWKMADIIAPSVAVGLCLGRVGCLLNGCCYGNVATCEYCPHIAFPLSAPSRFDLVKHGYQTAAGFTIAGDRPVTVGTVAEDSPAYEKGLRPGDQIVKIRDFNKPGDDQTIEKYYDPDPEDLRGFWNCLVIDWPRGKTDLALTVVHRNGLTEDLPAFTPWTLYLHPTQIYESVSMLLLFFLLTAYYPFRRHDGEVMVLFMIGYAIHRFLNEMLRNDTDPVAFTGMTLSQNGSILFFVVALILAVILWRKPVRYRPAMA